MNVQQRQCLKEELAMFWKDNPGAQSSLSALRRLPYLSACINEGLRLGAGSMKRSPRVFAHDETPYKGWAIPRKVCASDSCESSRSQVENYSDSHLYDNLLYAHGSRHLPGAGKV